jgi:uncharacterized protein (TIGR02646 family)
MRFIDIAYVRAPEGFAELVAAAEKDEDNIKNHSGVWRACKPFLKGASYDKCYYCEMKDLRSDGAVDHYRPKSKYIWAAYRLDNFRFSCTFCNSRRSDPQTGEVRGKGDVFPLFEGSSIAMCIEDICNEFPILLDPCKAGDPGAIDFRGDGIALPRSNEDTDPQWRRAAESIEAYHLNHSELVEARRCIAIEIQEKVGELERALLRRQHGDVGASETCDAAVRDLARRLQPSAELSVFSKRVLQAYRSKSFIDDILATA